MRMIFFLLLLATTCQAAQLSSWNGHPLPFSLFFGGQPTVVSGDSITAIQPLTFVFDASLGFGPPEIAAFEATVRADVQRTWNNVFAVRNEAGQQLNALVDVTFGPDGHPVFVHAGPGHTIQNEWYVGQSGSATAHEVGHWLGLYDEYDGGGLVPFADGFPPTISSDGLMGYGALLAHPVMYPRYYEWFPIDAHDLLGGEWELVPVPEPSGILLGLVGLFFVVVVVCFAASKDAA